MKVFVGAMVALSFIAVSFPVSYFFSLAILTAMPSVAGIVIAVVGSILMGIVLGAFGGVAGAAIADW